MKKAQDQLQAAENEQMWLIQEQQEPNHENDTFDQNQILADSMAFLDDQDNEQVDQLNN